MLYICGMMLITNVKVEVTNLGVGCEADVIVSRGGERVVVPVVSWIRMEVMELDRVNQHIKGFFDQCKREYDSHVISERDRQITRDYLKAQPMPYHDVEEFYKEEDE